MIEDRGNANSKEFELGGVFMAVSKGPILAFEASTLPASVTYGLMKWNAPKNRAE